MNVPTKEQLLRRIRWVNVLRLPPEQGGYRQCQGTLRVQGPNHMRYCCLGVAEDLRKPMWFEDSPVTQDYKLMNHDGGWTFGGMSSYGLEYYGFSPVEAKWGIIDFGVDLLRGDMSLPLFMGLSRLGLTQMNDTLDMTFAQIADVIWYFLVLPFIGIALPEEENNQ